MFTWLVHRMIIDMHSHILPNADHGSDGLDCSEKQLNKAAMAGIGVIVATPHFYTEESTVADFLNRREQAYDSIKRVNKPGIKIVKGAEVTINPGIEELPGLDRLCVGHTKYVLLEMPSGIWNDWVYETVYKIKAKCGLNPVIAHIERYHPDSLEHLLGMNVVLQVNAKSLLPIFKRRSLIRMMASEKVMLLGSDAHGEASEYEAFAKALRILGKDMSSKLMSTAKRILNDQEV
jgi:protein-tyrosine phosphatase